MELLFSALHLFQLQRSIATTPLRQKMLEDVHIRNLTDNTKLSYVQQVGLYAKYFHRSPDLLEPQEVREYKFLFRSVKRQSQMPGMRKLSLMISDAGACDAVAPGQRYG